MTFASDPEDLQKIFTKSGEKLSFYPVCGILYP